MVLFFIRYVSWSDPGGINIDSKHHNLQFLRPQRGRTLYVLQDKPFQVKKSDTAPS